MTSHEADLMRQANDRLRLTLARMGQVIAKVRQSHTEAMEALDAARCLLETESAMFPARARLEGDLAAMTALVDGRRS